MKRFLVILLALTMVVLPVSVFGAYDDTDGHWAEDAIARWTGHGIVEGNGGQFNPDDNMTRAEAAAVFARLLNLEAKADITGFADVPADAWYADVIAQCVAAGIMNGTGEDTMDPNGTLTREQMMVMMCRALGIAPQETMDKEFDDTHEVSDWAEGYINALVNMGIVNGMTEDTLEPELDMNRASMMALLDKSILAYGDSEGGTIDVPAEGTGVVLIVADNVKVENAPAGTVVVTGQEAAGTTVNGSAVEEDDVHVVPEANKPAGGGGGGAVGGGDNTDNDKDEPKIHTNMQIGPNGTLVYNGTQLQGTRVGNGTLVFNNSLVVAPGGTVINPGVDMPGVNPGDVIPVIKPSN